MIISYAKLFEVNLEKNGGGEGIHSAFQPAEKS